MSTTVDNKVVEMRFDNRQFESNVQTSLNTLEKLKQKLDFHGAEKNFDKINQASGRVDFGPLSSATEKIGLKFNAMYTMADQAFRNITNSAMAAGKRMIKAFTVDPIKQGFSEYETKMGSIQTIMSNTASKGTTMDQVTATLDELNKYADKTIYNFAEMTRNIGTFTAAGIGLEDSAKAIQGIANLAAASGSNSQQASTAMYQLSQALSSGTLKLQDWNSVVNAGMGGQLFQDALKATAKAHGVAVDAIIKKNGSFRESLKDGWVTSEILTETLSKMTKTGAAEYLSKLTGISQEQIKATQKQVGANKDGTASYEALAEQMAKTGKVSKEEALNILKMADNAEDAATKVKTWSQLIDTLKEAAQSGWTETWEIIVGDFDEAKELFTSISDALGKLIGDSANARNNLLKGWKDLGGRTAIIETLKIAFENVMDIVNTVKDAFREVIPPMTAKQLADFSKNLVEMMKGLKLSDKALDNLKRTFKGLFAIIDIARQAIVAVWKAIKPLITGVDDLAGGALGVTAGLGDWLVKLDELIKKSDIFNKILQPISKFLKTGFGVISDIVGGVIDAFSGLSKAFSGKIDFSSFNLFHAILGRSQERISQIGDTAKTTKDIVIESFDKLGQSLANSKFMKFLDAAWGAIKRLGKAIGTALGDLVTNLTDKLKNANFDSFIDLMNGVSFGAIALSVTKLTKAIKDSKKEAGGIKGIIDALGDKFQIEKIVEILDGVKGCLESYQKQLKANTLLKIAGAIGILAASITVISLIDSDKLAKSLGAITGLFADLMGSMFIFTKLGGIKGDTTKAVLAMIGMSTAVLILASAMKKVSDLDWNGVAKGLASVGGLSAMMLGIVKVLSKNGKQITKGIGGLISFSIAINILANACKKMAELSWEEIGKGLLGVTGVMGAVAGFLKLTDKLGGNTKKTAGALLILSIGLNILASAVKSFATMSWEQMGKGLLALGGSLSIIAGALHLFPKSKNLISIGVGMIFLSTAVAILGSAIKSMGEMSWEQMGKGLLTLAASLSTIALAMNLMPDGAKMLLIGVGLTAVSVALTIIAGALKSLGNMSWEQVGTGLAAMGGGLFILAGALFAMKGSMAGALALIVATGALAILAPILSLFGAMSLPSIGKSLLMLAGAFTVLGIAGALLAPVAPIILTLAGAIALIGVASLGIGVGLMAVGAGITAIAGSLAAGATSIVASIGIIITGLIGLIPLIAVEVGKGIIAIVKVIGEGAPVIIKAVVDILKAILNALIELVPLVVDGVFTLITSTVQALAKYAPLIFQAVLDLIYNLLKCIADNIHRFVEVATDIVVNFVKGITKALPKVIQAGFDMIIGFIKGLTDAINKNTPILVNAMHDLIMAIVKAGITVLTGGITTFKDAGVKIIKDGLIGGVRKMLSSVKSAFKDVVNGGKNSISGMWSDFKSVGSNIIGGLVEGIKSAAGRVISAAKGVVSDALQGAKNLLGIHSPSRAFAEVGKYSDLGLVEGLLKFGSRVKSAAMDVGGTALTGMKSAIANIANIIDGNLDMQPTIRPVLDTSGVTYGVNAIDKLFGNRQLGLEANVTTARLANNAATSMRTTTEIQNEMKFNDVNIVKAISELRTDTRALGSAIEKMQLSIDGDALVGRIIARVDSRLGAIAGHKARRN